MSQPLYEISKEYLQLQQLAEDADLVDETLIQAYQDTMESTKMSFEEKAQNMVSISKNITATVESLDQEIKRLQAKKTTILNKDSWFKEQLRTNMEATGINKISCPLFTITLSKAREMVEILDEMELPDDCIEIENKIKPNKVKILSLLKSGEEVPGARITESKRGLLIK